MKSDYGYHVLQAGESFSLMEVPAGTALSISPTGGASVTGQYSVSGLRSLIPCEFGTVTQRLVTTIDGSCFELLLTATGGQATIEWSNEK